MGVESFSQEDIERWRDYIQTPEGHAIYEQFVFRAILHTEGIDLPPKTSDESK